MIPRLYCDCLIQPKDVKPSDESMEVIGAFNPGAVAMGGDVVLMVRIAEACRERRPGQIGLPRFDFSRGLVIDWFNEDEVEMLDPRVVRIRANGMLRLTFLSHLRIYHAREGRAIDWSTETQFPPDSRYEEYGVEDPRITRIGDTCYITYVSVSRHGAGTSLASTRDFKRFERHGVIFCPENKDVVLFPEQINDQYVCINRPNPSYKFSPPEMWIAWSPDLLHWGRQEALHLRGIDWGLERTGAGTPPVRVDGGWLLIYHGSDLQAAANTAGIGTYQAGTLLLDEEDPTKVIAYSTSPFMKPQEQFECLGFVPNVVFPTGIVDRGDRFQVYYGAADNAVGLIEFGKRDLLGTLREAPGAQSTAA